jgi:hypothetical protein
MLSALAPTTATLPADLGEALRRVKADFLEMPGLQVSLNQASRLWGLDATVCRVVLDSLVATGFIVRTDKALFSRP